MNILAVDSDAKQLDRLIGEIGKLFSHSRIEGFTDPAAAEIFLKQMKAEGKKPDYAFLAVPMPERSGLVLAEKVKEIFPRAALIFCAEHTQYAYEAMTLYAKGYLMKPISAEQIEKTLDEMVPDWRGQKACSFPLVRVQTFGHFAVFVDGRPLSFRREKAKELLAYLVDRRGAAVTNEQIAAVLWEDRAYDRKLKNHVTTICSSLRSTLWEAGIDEILIKSRNHLAVDTEKLSCDAYDYEQGKETAVRSFKGEYMTNYSWAEVTAGRYVQMKSLPTEQRLEINRIDKEGTP